MTRFEWDPRKAAFNLQKHRVSFEETTSAFYDPLSITIHDPDHSDEEDRYLLIGLSRTGKLMVVSHTDIGDRIRLISARMATRKERTTYEGT